MDFIMGLPKTERQHDAIFTFVDRLTKYVHVIPTKSTIDAEGAARLYVYNGFAYHGLSKSIVSDRDQRFTSAFFNPFTATGYFDIPPPRWPTFLAMLFPILKEGMGLSLLDEFEVQYHVIKK